jgi:hypothetical protein
MAWNITGELNVNWVPDGAGPMSVASMQTLQLDIGPLAANNLTGYGPVQIVTSTNDTLTAAQVNTACTTLGSLVASYFGTTALSTLQGWATGSP